MKIVIDVTPENLVDGLFDDLVNMTGQDEAFNLIVELDKSMCDYEFTERLVKHFISELIKASEEPFNVNDLLPDTEESKR